MLEVYYLFWYSCIVFFLLACAVLKILHSVMRILDKKECRSIGEAGWWDDELAVALAEKPPVVVQEVLDVLEENMHEFWYDTTTKRIQSKLSSTYISLCRL